MVDEFNMKKSIRWFKAALYLAMLLAVVHAPGYAKLSQEPQADVEGDVRGTDQTGTRGDVGGSATGHGIRRRNRCLRNGATATGRS